MRLSGERWRSPCLKRCYLVEFFLKHACTFTWLLSGDIPSTGSLTSMAALFPFYLGYEERLDVGDSCITTTIEWDVHNEAHETCVST